MKDDKKPGQNRITKLVARTRDTPKTRRRMADAVAGFGRRRVPPREVKTYTQEQRLFAILMPPLERGPRRRAIPDNDPSAAPDGTLESEPIGAHDESGS